MGVPTRVLELRYPPPALIDHYNLISINVDGLSCLGIGVFAALIKDSIGVANVPVQIGSSLILPLLAMSCNQTCAREA